MSRWPAATRARASATTRSAPRSSRWSRASGRGAVTVAAIASALLGLLLVVQYALVDEFDGPSGDSSTGLLVFAAVMFVAAFGMWRSQYWAVLGFQFFLGLTLVFAAVSLMFAGNLRASSLRRHPRARRHAVLEARASDGAAADAQRPGRSWRTRRTERR